MRRDFSLSSYSPQKHGVMKRNTVNDDEVRIVGFRVEAAEKDPEIDDGVPVLRANTKVTFRLFGISFKNTTTIGLTTEKLEYGTSCNMMVATGLFKIMLESSTNARVEVLLPEYSAELFICATHEDNVSRDQTGNECLQLSLSS